MYVKRFAYRKMLLIKVIILTVYVAWSEARDPGYRIRKFQHNPGMYYEKYGTMLHVSEKWRLVVRLDVSTVYTRVDQAKRVLRNTEEACGNVTVIREKKREFCVGFVAELQQRLRKVEGLAKRVKAIVGTPTRYRRGLVDAVGSIAKTLFGTMDADDEKQISEQIELLSKKQAVLQHVIKNQLQVVNATIAHVENVEEIVERNENRLRNAVLEITKRVDDYARQAELTEYFMELGGVITELEFDVESVMGYITDVQTKFAQLEVVPVELILKSLRDASSWSTHGLHFPFAVTLENWLVIKEYVTVSVYCKDANVYTIVKFPLVEPVEYNVFRVVPLPAHDHDNVFTVALIKNQMIAVDANRQTYSIVTRSQLDRCKHVKDDYVCDNIESVYRVHADAPCEVQAYISESGDLSNCKEETVMTNHTVWIKLEKMRVWLYSTLRSESVLISCENQKEQSEVVDGVGEIELAERCKLITSSISIHTNRVINGVQINTYLPRFNLSKIKAVHRATDSKLTEIESVTKSKTQVRKLQAEVTELTEELDKGSGSFYENPHFIYPTTSGITIIIIVIGIIVYKLVKNKEKKELARVAVKLRNTERRERRKDVRAQNVETVAL